MVMCGNNVYAVSSRKWIQEERKFATIWFKRTWESTEHVALLGEEVKRDKNDTLEIMNYQAQDKRKSGEERVYT